MDRDEVALLLGLPLGILVLWLCGGVVPSVRRTSSEFETSRAVWLPMIPSGMCMLALLGWAFVAPEAPQHCGALRILLFPTFAVVALRALIRSARALFVAHAGVAQVRGLFRPRITIDSAFRRALSPAEYRAVLLHEEAHARHYDPLRIWLARVATDMQWPLSAAERRYVDWTRALELSRDAEACERGADPLALASAIVKAAALATQSAPHHAGFASNSEFLAHRVERLLGVEPRRLVPPRSCAWVAASLLALAFVLGAVFGDAIVPWFAG